MMKVLIVDDSVSSRTDLKTMLDWEEYGYEIIGEASNGSEAIKHIHAELPDLIITDMNMPVLDGVKLIEYVRQNCPQVKIIALSAYDDFNFVRQSMKNGAVDYILKHQLQKKELLDLLQSIEEEIRKEKVNLGDDNHALRSNRMLRQQFVLLLLEGGISAADEIEQKLQQLQLELDLKNLMITIAEIDDFWEIEERLNPSELEVFLNTFLEISMEIMKEWEKSIIVPITKGRFAMIFSLGNVHSKMYNYNRQYNILNRIRSEIKRYMNITASFGVSHSCPSITELPLAYQEAKLRLENKFYKGKNGIFIENVEKFEDGFFYLDIEDEKVFYTALRNLDHELINEQINKIFNKISSLRLRSKSTRMICAELINIITRVCRENGIEVSKLYTVEEVPYHMIEKYETLEDIKQWVSHLFNKLLSILEQLRIDNNLSTVNQRAITFIQEHYSEDISLTDVADHIGISAPYFSKIFKEECGMGFSEYLNHVRISNAKWLIKNGENKISEVASRVGFNSYHYFFRVFKKIEGITPLEFERQCRMNTG